MIGKAIQARSDQQHAHEAGDINLSQSDMYDEPRLLSH